MAQESKMQINRFAAEGCSAAGGVFNAVTKAGTNDFRSSACEIRSNDKLIE